MFLVISSSLHPTSRSRVMARSTYDRMVALGHPVEFIDLRDLALPFCDAGACYAHPNVGMLGKKIREARAILVATPIYNYDACASLKNAIELTGKNWTDKVVGFVCAAGGAGSYMAIMAVANSLMLDFHSFIVPKFVYATGRAFDGEKIIDPEVERRLAEFAAFFEKTAFALTASYTPGVPTS